MLTDQSKNMIFFVNDFDELLSWILYSSSAQHQQLIVSNQEMSTSPECRDAHGEYGLEETLPRLCIKIDEHFLWSQIEKNCTKILAITSTELKDNSALSDPLFEATRGLYINKIWNFKNHIVFLLKNVRQPHNESQPKSAGNLTFTNDSSKNQEADATSSMAFCFQFFWRFFKGYKTIICHAEGCNKYNPFTENIILLEGEAEENFLDFSWKSMHGKPLKVFMDYYSDIYLKARFDMSSNKFFIGDFVPTRTLRKIRELQRKVP